MRFGRRSAHVLMLVVARNGAVLSACTPTSSHVAGTQHIRVEYRGSATGIVDGTVPGDGYKIGLASDGAVSTVNGEHVIVDDDTDSQSKISFNLVRFDRTLWGPVTVTDLATGVSRLAIVDTPAPTPKVDGDMRRIEFIATGADIAGASPTPLTIDVRLDIDGNSEPTTTTTTTTTSVTVTTTPGTTIPTTIPPEQAYTVDATAIVGGQVGVGYEHSVEVVGSDVDLTDVTWSIESGELPPGLDMDDWGTIAGTPTAIGTYTFTASAFTPETNRIGSAAVTIDIIAATTLLPAVFDDDNISEITTTFGQNETRETFATLDGTGSFTITACTANSTLPSLTLYDANNDLVTTGVASTGGGCVEIDPSVWPEQASAAALPAGTYRITLTYPGTVQALRASADNGSTPVRPTILQIVKSLQAVAKARSAPLIEPTNAIATMIDATGEPCATTAAGGVKCWGNNDRGQLGDGTRTDSNVPVDVEGLSSGVKAISVDGTMACALTVSGVGKCWGSDYDDWIGNDPWWGSDAPTDHPLLAGGVEAISIGLGHSCAIVEGGGAKCWSANRQGQLGNGGYEGSNIQVDVVGLTSGVKAIAVGAEHSCAVTAAGGVKCWGSNSYRELGNELADRSTVPVDPSGLTSGVKSISTRGRHTCALTLVGGVKCWGTVLFGQLLSQISTTPSDVPGLTSGVKAISAGFEHSCAVTAAGGVKCWGSNSEGQLGDGTNSDSSVPVDVLGLTSGVETVSVGFEHSCAVTAAGGVKCWGSNSEGQLGDGTNTDSNVPVDVKGFGSTTVFDNTPRPGCAPDGGMGSPADFIGRNAGALQLTTRDAYERMRDVTSEGLMDNWLEQVEKHFTTRTNPVANGWSNIRRNMLDNLVGAIPFAGTAYGMTVGNLDMLDQVKADLRQNELVDQDENMIAQTNRLRSGLWDLPTNGTGGTRDEFYGLFAKANLYKYVAAFGHCPGIGNEGDGDVVTPKHRGEFDTLIYNDYFPGEVWATQQTFVGPLANKYGAYTFVEDRLFAVVDAPVKTVLKGRLAKSIDEYFDLEDRVRSDDGSAVVFGQAFDTINDNGVGYAAATAKNAVSWYVTPDINLASRLAVQFESSDVMNEAFESRFGLEISNPTSKDRWGDAMSSMGLIGPHAFDASLWNSVPRGVLPYPKAKADRVVLLHDGSMKAEIIDSVYSEYRYVWVVSEGVPFAAPSLEKQLTLPGYRYPQALPGGKRM